MRSVSIPMLGARMSLNEKYARAIVRAVALAAQGHELQLQLRSVACVRLVAYEEEQRLAFCAVLADTVRELAIGQ